jgi:hypothetical protein
MKLGLRVFVEKRDESALLSLLFSNQTTPGIVPAIGGSQAGPANQAEAGGYALDGQSRHHRLLQ